MKKKIITGMLIVSVAAANLIAFGPNHNARGFGHKPPIVKVLKELDLSDAQKEALKALRDEQIKIKKAFIEQKMADSEVFFTEAGFDRKKFISKATAGFEIRINARADFIEKVYAILDENQRVEFAHMMQEMRAQRGK